MANRTLNIALLVSVGCAIMEHAEPHTLPNFKSYVSTCIDGIHSCLEISSEEWTRERYPTLWQIAELLIGSLPKSNRHVECVLRELSNRLRRLRMGLQTADDAYQIASLVYSMDKSEYFIEATA